ncbi:MAG TPA: dipicolinate synthase subunit B [Ruminococcaceae bacterium]|nr:dipicolinate synthase subunit B [Oscillospiraceae bacterium]
MNGVKIGFALCGSFCTFESALAQMEQLKKTGADVTPIFSEQAYNTDTRFGTAKSFRERAEAVTGQSIIHTIVQAEPIGPKKMFDLLLVEPCTGNTLGKLANGITDTAVTMACKSHLRTARPLLLAVSTNDALSGSAKSIGALMSRSSVFFVPMRQDNSAEKPRSIVADFSKTEQAIRSALKGEQLQPIVFG